MQGIVLDSIRRDELENIVKECIREELEAQASSTSSNEEEELIDSKEAASLLRVSTVTLHHWKKQGRIPYYRIGSRIRFKKKEVLEALNNCEKYSRK